MWSFTEYDHLWTVQSFGELACCDRCRCYEGCLRESITVNPLNKLILQIPKIRAVNVQ